MLYLARVQPIIILSSLSGIQLPEYGSPSDPLCPSWGVNSSWVLTHLGLGVRSVWFSDLIGSVLGSKIFCAPWTSTQSDDPKIYVLVNSRYKIFDLLMV